AIAADGRPRVVLVTGEAGIGKSRFADAVVDALARDGWLVAIGRAVRFDSGSPPYLPFVQVIRIILGSIDVAQRVAMLGPIRDDIAVLLPELGLRRTEGSPAIDDGVLRQARLFEGVLDLGERVAASWPLAVVIEDLQWL